MTQEEKLQHLTDFVQQIYWTAGSLPLRQSAHDLLATIKDAEPEAPVAGKMVKVKAVKRQPRAIQWTGDNYDDVQEFRILVTGAEPRMLGPFTANAGTWFVELINDPEGRAITTMADFWFKEKYQIL